MFDFWPVYSGERFRASGPSCWLTWAKGPRGAYSIGRLRRPSSVRPSVHNFKRLLLWNYWADCNQFHIQSPGPLGKINCSNGLGHMTNMAAMLIYGKNLKKPSPLEPIDQWPWNIGCSIVYESTTNIMQIMILGWPWPILRQSQIWPRRLLYGKKWKLFIFLETIAALSPKVAWSN